MTRFYMLAPRDRRWERFQCTRSIDRRTAELMRRAYRDARRNGVDPTSARQAVIIGALVEWQVG